MRTTVFAAGLVLIAAGCSSPPGSASGGTHVGTPLPAVTSTTEATPSPSEPALGDLPQGQPPRVPYAIGKRRLITPSQVVQVPRLRTPPSGAVPFARGHLVADSSWFEGSNGLHLVRDGGIDETWAGAPSCSAGSPKASADGSRVAWVSLDCPESGEAGDGTVHRADGQGRNASTWPTGTGLVSIAGFLGDQVVFNRGFIDGAWVTDFHEATRIGDVDRVADVSPRGNALIGQKGDRARLLIAESGAVRWRAEAGRLQAFSPSGARVLALTRRSAIVLDSADGTVLATVPRPADSDAVVWESETALLAVLSRKKQSTIVRLHLDGSVERATGVRRATPHGPAFTLLG